MPLAHYSKAATQEFWTEHWGGQDAATLLAVAHRSPLTELIERALPPDGLVLEAGCGVGQYVALLRSRGRRVVGVDWSAEALARGRAAFPGVPLTAMDLDALGLPSGTVSAYLSLGVVEHDPEGPARLLAEAHRVLAPGGRLVLSVPYLNGARRLLRPVLASQYRAVARAGGRFYQFLFTRHEVRAFVEAAGFRVLSLTPYDPARVLRAAMRPLRGATTKGARPPGPPNAPERAGVSRGLVRSLLYTQPMLRLLGHMILAVAVKR
jgi:SAM-dependent methyltransferase